QSLRLEAVRRAYGPAGGWFVRERLAGRVPLHLGSNITRATPKGSRVEIGVGGADGGERHLAWDHLVAATGYRVDMSRLSVLSPPVRSQLRTLQGAPVLSSKFESSVGGLYFVGLAAANTFGPVMRFVYGAGFAARQLSRELSRPRAKAAV